MAPKIDWESRKFEILTRDGIYVAKAECGEVLEGRLVPGTGPGNFVIQFRGMDETAWRKHQAIKEAALKKAETEEQLRLFTDE